MKHHRFAFVALLGLMVASFGPARAGDLVVIASTGSEIGVGSILDGGKPIELAAGTAVTFVSADGRTLKFTGPYSGVPDPSPAAGQPDLLDALSDIVKPSKKDVASAGIMRAGIYTPKDPWVIDSGHSGAQCVLRDRPAMLWRAIAIGPASASLTAGARDVAIEWQDGSYTTPWPAALPMQDDESYVLRFTVTKKTERLDIHLIPEAVRGQVRRAAWMHREGCVAQAKALLESLG